MRSRRGAHCAARSPRALARRVGRASLFAVPLVALCVIALLAAGVAGTLSQITASVNNDSNTAQSAGVSLLESQNGVNCTAPGDSQWHPCGDINMYGGPAAVPTSTTVTLENTGTTPATLFVLPSMCSDTVTGAGGALCDDVSVTLTCLLASGASTTVVSDVTLNAFQAGRNWPTGYQVTTVDPGATISCTFDLAVTTTPSATGTVSQPIAWRLTVP